VSPTLPPRDTAWANSSSRVVLLTQSRSQAGAPTATARTRSIDQCSSPFPKSTTRTGSEPVWSTPMIRTTAHPARDGERTLGLGVSAWRRSRIPASSSRGSPTRRRSATPLAACGGSSIEEKQPFPARVVVRRRGVSGRAGLVSTVDGGTARNGYRTRHLLRQQGQHHRPPRDGQHPDRAGLNQSGVRPGSFGRCPRGSASDTSNDESYRCDQPCVARSAGTQS
jgi:hypothetical protein